MRRPLSLYPHADSRRDADPDDHARHVGVAARAGGGRAASAILGGGAGLALGCGLLLKGLIGVRLSGAGGAGLPGAYGPDSCDAPPGDGFAAYRDRGGSAHRRALAHPGDAA